MINDLEKRSDEEIIGMFRSGDAQAGHYILEKYKPLVKKRARLYYLEGGDHEDLLQEGMIGLLKAVREYDKGRESSFPSYAALCVNHQMLSAIEAAGRKKHKVLNESVSLEAMGDDFNEKSGAVDYDPETLLVEREAANELRSSIYKSLSAMEKSVLELYLEGLDYRQIAHQLEKSEKSIDNALQRIKGKVKKSI